MKPLIPAVGLVLASLVLPAAAADVVVVETPSLTHPGESDAQGVETETRTTFRCTYIGGEPHRYLCLGVGSGGKALFCVTLWLDEQVNGRWSDPSDVILDKTCI